MLTVMPDSRTVGPVGAVCGAGAELPVSLEIKLSKNPISMSPWQAVSLP